MSDVGVNSSTGNATNTIRKLWDKQELLVLFYET